MNKQLFLVYIGTMQDLIDNDLYPDWLEMCLRGLKGYFNEDQVTDIEDKLFGLNDKISSFSPEQFYEYLQTKS